MKKEEFIAALAAEIRDLSKEDIANSLEYYGEMIDERVEDGMSVDEAVEALGGVEGVAGQIMAELPRERRNRRTSLDDDMDDLDRELKELDEEDDIGVDFDDGVGADFDDGVGADFDDEDEEGERWYRITEPFTAADVQAGNSDVRILRSNDGETHIETECYDGVEESVTVRNGVLTVIHSVGGREARRKKGSFFGLKFNAFIGGSGSITLYLADELWESVNVQTFTGEIEAEDVRARAMRLAAKSGDVDARHLVVEGQLELESMSGDLELDDVTAGELSAHSMSGDVSAESTHTGAATLQSKSGDLKLEEVCVEGMLRAESISGDIVLRRSDAGELSLRSTSGDVGGTLLTPKNFSAHSMSGDVRLPQSDPTAGRCEASTTSGDVSLRIAP